MCRDFNFDPGASRRSPPLLALAGISIFVFRFSISHGPPLLALAGISILFFVFRFSFFDFAQPPLLALARISISFFVFRFSISISRPDLTARSDLRFTSKYGVLQDSPNRFI